MLVFNVTDARKNWATILGIVTKERVSVYLTKNNKVVAEIRPIEEVSSLESKVRTTESSKR